MSELKPVVFADDLEDCPDCGEKWCSKHRKHFFACACVGPMQDDEYEYVEKEGRMYAKPRSKSRGQKRPARASSGVSR